MAVTICQRYHVNVYLSKLYHVRILLYVHMYLYTACKYTKILLVGIALPKHHFLKRFIFLSKRPAPTTNDSNRRASSLNLPISRLDSPLAPPTTNVQGPILSTVNLGLEDSPIDYVMIYIYIHVYVHAYIYSSDLVIRVQDSKFALNLSANVYGVGECKKGPQCPKRPRCPRKARNLLQWYSFNQILKIHWQICP